MHSLIIAAGLLVATSLYAVVLAVALRPRPALPFSIAFDKLPPIPARRSRWRAPNRRHRRSVPAVARSAS